MIERKFTFTKEERNAMPVMDRIKKVMFENELDVIDIPFAHIKIGRREVESVQYNVSDCESSIIVYDKDDFVMTPTLPDWVAIAQALEKWSEE